MEILYLIGLEILFSIFLIEFISLKVGIITSLFLICILGGVLKERSALFYLLPFIFLFRMNSVVFDSSKIVVGDRIGAKIRVYEGVGEILRINGGYPDKNEVIRVKGLEDGEYEISGKIKKIDRKKYKKEYFLEEEKFSLIEKNRLKKWMESLVKSRIEGMSFAEQHLYKSVIIGVKDGMHSKVKNLFLQTGLMHLLAISGLHIGIILWGIKKLFSLFNLSKRGLNTATLIGLTIYFLAIRVSPSVQRAYIMSVIYLLGAIFYENADLKKSLTVAFILSLLINPISYREPSFIMSYWAMGSIVLGEKGLRKIGKWIDKKVIEKYEYLRGIVKYFCFSVYIQFAMIPVTFLIFGNFRWIGILASTILTPIGIVYIFLAFVNLIIPVGLACSFIFKILVNSMEFFV